MRLFVGVNVGPDVAAAAAALVNRLRHRAASLAPGARISWVPPERLHLTLRFIGAVDDSTAAAVRSLLADAVDEPPFVTTFAGSGAFPARGEPRVLWAGVVGGGDALARIERHISQRLTRAGLPTEDRPYSPHLTLARVRNAAGLRAAVLFEGLATTPLGSTRVSAITLFESRLSSRGSTYVPLQEIGLRRPPENLVAPWAQ